MGVTFLNTGIPASILGALGSGEEQRKRRDEMAIQEALNRYRAETLGLDRERLAETTRQANLRYGPATVNVPGVGEITAQREFIPALIAAASAREKDISPEEVTALEGYRGRALMPPGGTLPVKGYAPGWDPALEVQATKQALSEGAAPGSTALPAVLRELGPMTVNQPQTNVPRQSFEKIMTEAAAQRKEMDVAAHKEKQGKANARYRQLYSTAISQKIPHALADATAIAQATQEFGIAPEREAFVGEPKPEQKMSVEDEYLKALQTPEAERTGYERAVIKQYQANKERERSPTLVDLAIRASQGDAEAKKALDTYQKADRTERDAAWSKATTILSQARNMRAQEQGRFGKIIMDPTVEEAEIGRIANQLAVGTGDPVVRQIVADMTGGLGGGGIQPPRVQPPAAPTFQPRPAPAVRPPVPTGAPETLSRRDPRYSRLQGRGLSDQQIEAQFNVRLAP